MTQKLPKRDPDYKSQRGNLYWFKEMISQSQVHGVCLLVVNINRLVERVDHRNEELIDEIQQAYLSWKLM